MKVYLLLIVIFIIPISLIAQRTIYSNTVYLSIPSTNKKTDTSQIEIKEKSLPEPIEIKIEKENILVDNEEFNIDSKVEIDTIFENNQSYQTISISFKPKFLGKKQISDFPSGGYILKTSKISNQLTVFVKETLDNQIKPFLDSSSIVLIRIKGTADATPIKGIRYKGEFGNTIKEKYSFKRQNIDFSVKINSYISKNEGLAFLRTMGIRTYLESNIDIYNKIRFEHEVEVFTESGEQFRTVTIEVLLKKQIPDL